MPINETWKTILTQSWILTKANLKSRYRNSLAGYLWVLMNPLLTYMVQGYVFKIVFKIPVENYFLFLLFGLIPWIFFSQTIDMVTTSFYYNGRLLKSVKVHPLSLILSQALDNLINSLMVMVFVLFILSLAADVPWSKIYLFPLPYASLAISTVTLGFYFSALHVRYHDIKFVLSFALNILFFITPVIYPESFVPQSFKFLIYINPIYYLLKPWRVMLESGASPLFWKSMLESSLLTLMISYSTILYWKKRRNLVYLHL